MTAITDEMEEGASEGGGTKTDADLVDPSRKIMV
jgi:hypothetical protein